jgi:predicted negative regulator of RcsB-dependent stress response
MRQKAANAEVYSLLGDIYEKTGKPAAAKKVYRQALADAGMPPGVKQHFQAKLLALKTQKDPP